MSGLRSCPQRGCSFLFMMVLILGFSFFCQAQTLPLIPGDFGSIERGRIEIVPFAQVGYKNIGLNLNFPFAFTPIISVGPLNGPPALDLKLRDAGVWVGSVGLNTCVYSNYFVSVRVDGSTKKHVDVFAGENFPYFGLPTPFTWSGSNVQWWDADGMIGCRFYGDWFLLGGLRYDKLTLTISSPVDSTGVPLNNFGRSGDTFSGDILIETWIPYFGLQLKASCYRASISYSPFASPKVTAPQVINGPSESEELKWSFAKPGAFLEGLFEYDWALRSSLRFGLWAKGTWMKSRGNGNWDFQLIAPRFHLTATAEESTTSTLSRYELGGGITASWEF